MDRKLGRWAIVGVIFAGAMALCYVLWRAGYLGSPLIPLVGLLVVILISPIARRRFRHSPKRPALDAVHTRLRALSRFALVFGMWLILVAFVWLFCSIVVLALAFSGPVTMLRVDVAVLPFILLMMIGFLFITYPFFVWLLGLMRDDDSF